jgi:restriction system protein
MARSGSLAALEQRLAVQRREDDRRAREKRQRDRDQERVSQQEHLASQQEEAEEKTAGAQARMKALGEVLTSALPLRPLTFERLLAAPRTPDFDPGPLTAARPAPEWKDYARFDAAISEHRSQEAERRRALAVAKAAYDRKVTEERAKAAARNAYVTSRQTAFAARDPEAVRWFAGCVLRASRYPEGFPRDYQVTYDPRARCLAVELELPARGVVPAVRAYRYVKTRDGVEPVPRADSEISQAHERVVACVALRALHEIFGALPADLVQAVALTGWVATTDKATGAPIRPRLLDLQADRAVFAPLVLDAVDPIACLSHLTAHASPGLSSRSVGQRPGEPEDAQHAVVGEPGHGADLAAGQGEHDNPAGVRDRGPRIADVEAERGLAVGPDRHEPGGAPGPERGRRPEPGG